MAKTRDQKTVDRRSTGEFTAGWTFQQQSNTLKAARGASPPCILAKFQKIPSEIRFCSFCPTGRQGGILVLYRCYWTCYWSVETATRLKPEK